MVERHPILNMVSHLVLALGVLIVAFPLYITFVASTHTAQAIVQTPMPLLPGTHMLENYAQAWNGGGDGAGPWRRFWSIIFPLLSPVTFFLLVINIVYAFFDTFAIVDAATQGGPGKDTAILVYKVYYDGFKAMDLGGSAAQSVVLMVIVIALTVVQFRYVEKKVNY